MIEGPLPLVYAPPAGPLVVLHEDRDLVAVDKLSGLFSIPGRDPAHADSALSRVLLRWPTALVVHRLDLGTSGVLVFALRRKAEAAVREQFQRHGARKRYVARVAGRLEGEGVVDLALAPDPAHLPLQRVDPEGRPALTRWRSLDAGGMSSLVELFPTTGRTHQLRVHLLALGHPILGDALYAPAAVRDAAPRLMLHAQRLELVHPYSGAPLVIEAAVPAELVR